MQFGVLGPLRVMAGESDEAGTISAPRLRALLAVLLWRANQPVPTDELAELVWDGTPPSGAREATRALVMRLRRQLGERAAARIVTRPPGYMIEVSRDELDASWFEVLTHEAGAAVRGGRWAQAAQTASQARRLWRGTPLTDIPSQLLRDQWVPRLEQLLVQALEWHIEAGLHESRHEQLIPELRDLTARYPLRERFYGQLMLALYRCGRQADALAAYQRARDVLVTELGVEPGHALANLHQQILTGNPALSSHSDRGLAARLAHETATAFAVDMRFSLPPDSAAFTGRDSELHRIAATVRDSARAGGVVAIHAIGGMPGVGKTALAVHAAHLLREEFPGRCLFIDLHAHTPGHDPVSPETALAGLLVAAGVQARNLPSDLEGRAALWRDTMAGQRGLLVLDNAASSRQVAPLLPGGDGCLVLVTSRRHLADLPAASAPLQLDTLPPRQAREMFARLAPRAAAGPDEAVDDLMSLAGYLPLELSYQHLDPAQQRFFNLLSLHPGGTTDSYAAAALTGTALRVAVRMLDELHGEGLLTETGYRRYGMHDLLRRYARDHASTLPPRVAGQAVGRLLDYYQHTATLAQDLLANQTRPGPLPATPQPLAAPTLAAPTLESSGRALAWARAERDSLLACLDHSTNTGQHARVIALTAALAELLRRDGPWTDAINRYATALHSASHLGDRPGQANTLNGRGAVRRLTGDYQGAIGDLEQALAIYRDLGHRLGQANALLCLGIMRRQTSDWQGAAADFEKALAIWRDLGDRRGEAEVLNEQGTLYRLSGEAAEAEARHRQALDLASAIGSAVEAAHALAGLGRCAVAAADPVTARANLRQAGEIFERIGAPEATLIATELATLTSAELAT